MHNQKANYIWGILRIFIGLIFIWAFFDKLFGLGFTTCLNDETGKIEIMCENAWLNVGSPTTGFLKFATKGPFIGIFQNLAGNVIVDWLFMLGLFLIGFALIFGVLVNIASISGILLLSLMWVAVLPPEHHPFLDEHIIYALVLLGLILSHAGSYFGLGKWWTRNQIVKKYAFLE